MSGITLYAPVVDAEIECGECGEWIPGDAGARNDRHAEWCDSYGRVLTWSDAAVETRDMIDEIGEPFKIGNLEYLAGTVLAAVDPIAFREEVLSYCDAHSIEIVNHY